MKNIIQQIPEGVSDFTYHVGSYETLTVVFFAKDVNKAETNITVNLDKKGATAIITGIVLAGGQSRITIRTMQIHESPETTSDLLVKTVLSGRASCSYDGGIRVAHTAQKTNAYQRNENLLLSEHVYAESKPSLEILANDVRCTHGAATGPIDEEQCWFLTSRGISKEQAEHLITSGFILSALDRIDDEKTKQIFMHQIADAL